MPGQINNSICILKFSHPWAQRQAIPTHLTPGSRARRATQHNNCVPIVMQGAGEERADLAGTTRENNLHVSASEISHHSRTVHVYRMQCCGYHGQTAWHCTGPLWRMMRSLLIQV